MHFAMGCPIMLERRKKAYDCAENGYIINNFVRIRRKPVKHERQRNYWKVPKKPAVNTHTWKFYQEVMMISFEQCHKPYKLTTIERSGAIQCNDLTESKVKTTIIIIEREVVPSRHTKNVRNVWKQKTIKWSRHVISLHRMDEFCSRFFILFFFFSSSSERIIFFTTNNLPQVN